MSDTGIPRWVKGLGIAFAAVILVLAVVLLATGGDHGPGRHAVGVTEVR